MIEFKRKIIKFYSNQLLLSFLQAKTSPSHLVHVNYKGIWVEFTVQIELLFIQGLKLICLWRLRMRRLPNFATRMAVQYSDLYLFFPEILIFNHSLKGFLGWIDFMTGLMLNFLSWFVVFGYFRYQKLVMHLRNTVSNLASSWIQDFLLFFLSLHLRYLGFFERFKLISFLWDYW